MLGLLRKILGEGFAGDLSWLQGGLQALWRNHRHLVNEGPPSDDEDDSEDSLFIRARDIPLAAFQRSTTTTVNSRMTSTGSPRPVHNNLPIHRPSTMSASPRRSAPPPRLDESSAIVAANPFYDNIRQNAELSHGITERIPLRLPTEIVSRIKDLPFPWLREIAEGAGQDVSTEALAMQFYRIELREQRRLHSVMAYHSRQSGGADDREGEIGDHATKAGRAFPYSIIAGIEKGAKNRFVNDLSTVFVKG